MMLQQTQVSRVLPIYSAFLQRFPSAETLAKSELGDVLHAWKGLGYNRRAKHLWQLSRLLPYSNNRKRVFPTSSEELQKLPGIGHYTQAAIRAFSYNADVVAQDTNVRRIHVRVFGDASETTLLAQLPLGRGREWNNALMDFGALVCQKKPRCEVCPLRSECKAYKSKQFDVPQPRQSPFAGSNRFYRGRIIDSLRAGPKTLTQLKAIGDEAKLSSALAQLLAEGLLKKKSNKYCL